MTTVKVESIIAVAQEHGRGASLHGANLHGANLHGANLRGARWDGFIIDGLHPYRCMLTPTPHGWTATIGCWDGTVDDLRELIAGDQWPEATGCRSQSPWSTTGGG